VELKRGAVVRATGPDHEHASKWKVLKLVQATRHRSSYLARNAHRELEDHQVIVTTCRYDPRLLGNRGYVDNVRRRLLHEAEMLTVPHNVFPEPVDLFRTQNLQDGFAFAEAERYRETEPVLVTEPYYGTPLDELVTRQGPLEQRRALRIGLKLCDLLDDLHRRNILIYEFRPEDILVDTTDDDRLWILGCANLQKIGNGKQVRVQDLIVPLSDFTYTAPEVEAGAKPFDRRADIYSFGALMLYTLTGHKPRQLIGEQGHNEAVYGLRELSPGTCRLLGRCLCFDPAFRWPGPKEVRVALREALASIEHPYPPPVLQVTAEDTGRQPGLSWQLPNDWSEAYGLRVLRWCDTADQPPPDVEHWEVVLDRTPCDALALTDDTGRYASTTHYAVIVQAPFRDRPLASHPVLTQWRAPQRPGTVLSLLLALTGRAARQVFVLLLGAIRRLRVVIDSLKQYRVPERAARGRVEPANVMKKATQKTPGNTGKASQGIRHSAGVGTKKSTRTSKAKRASPKPRVASKKASRPVPASKNTPPKTKKKTAPKATAKSGQKP
jgi:serine/threonine protein kinase